MAQVVVVVHEGEHLAVFTANVTPAFFAKLDDPRKPSSPGAVRDTRHRRGPGDQDAGQSSSADQEKGGEGNDSARLGSASDRPLPLRTVEGPMRLNLEAPPGGTDTKRKHTDGADQGRADLEENRRPPNTKKRR